MTEGWNFVLHKGCWSTPMLILVWRWVTVEQITYTSAINQHFIELISSRLNSLVLDACSVKKAVLEENIWFVTATKMMMCSKQACFHSLIRPYDSWNLVCLLCCIQKLSKTAYTGMGWYLNVYSDNILSMHSWPRISQTQTCSVCNNRQLTIWSSNLKQCICLEFTASHIFIEQCCQGSNLNQVVELSTITC
jgi:hypothetical protein